MCVRTRKSSSRRNPGMVDARQYVEDYTSGNVRISQLAAGFLYFLWRTVTEAGLGMGSSMRWIYDRFQRSIGGTPYPLRPFGVPKGRPTRRAQLDLQQSELVRYRNRGLYFDPEMVPFTERKNEVRSSVEADHRLEDWQDGPVQNRCNRA